MWSLADFHFSGYGVSQAQSELALFALVPSLVGVKENSIPMALQTTYQNDLARDTVEFARSMALGRC
jgi:hypothetical protein